MNITVEIANETEQWSKHHEINHQFFEKLVSLILAMHPDFSNLAIYELSVLLTDNKKMNSLNNKFRKKDKPTNVLSFPETDNNFQEFEGVDIENAYKYLGDIAFGYQIIEEEAKIKSISFQDHFIHLTIHAILHLIGYDHVSEEEAEDMEALEIEILKELGIDSPY